MHQKLWQKNNIYNKKNNTRKLIVFFWVLVALYTNSRYLSWTDLIIREKKFSVKAFQ